MAAKPSSEFRLGARRRTLFARWRDYIDSIAEADDPVVICRKTYLSMLPIGLLAAAPIVGIGVGIWWVAGGGHILQLGACSLIILANVISIAVAVHDTCSRVEKLRSGSDP